MKLCSQDNSAQLDSVFLQQQDPLHHRRNRACTVLVFRARTQDRLYLLDISDKTAVRTQSCIHQGDTVWAPHLPPLGSTFASDIANSLQEDSSDQGGTVPCPEV